MPRFYVFSHLYFTTRFSSIHKLSVSVNNSTFKISLFFHVFLLCSLFRRFYNIAIFTAFTVFTVFTVFTTIVVFCTFTKQKNHFFLLYFLLLPLFKITTYTTGNVLYEYMKNLLKSNVVNFGSSTNFKNKITFCCGVET